MKNFLILLTVIFICTSCSNNEPAHQDDHGAHDHGTLTHSPNEVTLTAEQAKAAGIEVVQPATRTISEQITVRGMLHVPPQNMVNITAPLGGIVKRTPLLPGDHVKRGQTIVVLQDPEFIRLQQDYLTSKAKLDLAQLELKRQEALSADNVNARKTVEQARTDVAILHVAVKALSEQLALIGISTNKLTPETISSEVHIKAPFNGYVTKVYVNTGTAVEPRGKVLDLVDPTHLHAELQVFERDATLLHDGQSMQVRITGEQQTRSAHVHLIGTEVDADRTVVVHAHLDKNDVSLRPGTTLMATISLNPHQALTIPETAVFTSDSTKWVFVQEKPGSYRKVQVTTGAHTNGFVAIDGTALTANTKVVVKGLR